MLAAGSSRWGITCTQINTTINKKIFDLSSTVGILESLATDDLSPCLVFADKALANLIDHGPLTPNVCLLHRQLTDFYRHQLTKQQQQACVVLSGKVGALFQQAFNGNKPPPVANPATTISTPSTAQPSTAQPATAQPSTAKLPLDHPPSAFQRAQLKRVLFNMDTLLPLTLATAHCAI